MSWYQLFSIRELKAKYIKQSLESRTKKFTEKKSAYKRKKFQRMRKENCQNDLYFKVLLTYTSKVHPSHHQYVLVEIHPILHLADHSNELVPVVFSLFLVSLVPVLLVLHLHRSWLLKICKVKTY